MADVVVPVAKRLQRPGWRDTRLLVGVFLVLLATVLGAKAVASFDDRVPMYQATQAIKPGDRLGAGNLKRVEVLLGDVGSAYRSASAPLPDDAYAVRTVPAGELLPNEAIGKAADLTVQPLTVRVDAVQVGGLDGGSLVDVYVNAATDRVGSAATAAPTGPKRLLESVTVASVTKDASRFGSSSSTSAVQILVPRANVSDLIAAIDAESKITLVPVPGSGSGSGS